MRTGKELVERIADIHGHDPDWVRFEDIHDGCPAFSCAKFHDISSETISAIMPFDAADGKHFQIEISGNGISICIFCKLDDAPPTSRTGL